MLNITTHKLVMNKIVKRIYSDISIAPLLGFKGGTALYMLYSLPRFSVDLDFDLLDETKKDLVFAKVSKIVENLGCVREQREKYFNLFWLISYEKGQKQVKVEISKRSFGSSYEVKSYLGFPIQVMKKEDMFAHKLTALLGRRELANRDIFDIWFMLNNNWDINQGLLESRVNMPFHAYLQKCLSLLEKNPPKRILDGLGEFLDNKMKAWVKEKLLEETIFLLKVKLQG